MMRHFEKQNSFHSDPDLTERGKRNAELLHAWLEKLGWKLPYKIVSSPKLRAQNSLIKLSLESEVPLIIDSRLDERTQLENRNEFKKRIEDFVSSFYSGQHIILCTHMDWIEMAIEVLDLDLSRFSQIGFVPGYYLDIYYEEGVWKVLNQGGPYAHT